MVNIEALFLDIDGVITDGRSYLSVDGSIQKVINFHDLDAINRIKREGVIVAFVTGEGNAMVETLSKRFRIEHVVTNAKDKIGAVEKLAGELGINLSKIAYVGDSDRDAPAIEAVGLGMAPANGSTIAKAAANRILTKAGGSGAVAEAIEYITTLQGASDPQRLDSFRNIVEASIAAHQRLLDESIQTISDIALVLSTAIQHGNKLLFCGNGGSAADAQHVAGELVGRFLKESEPYAAISLSTDTSIITAVGNDWEFEDIFGRQVRALAKPGDVVIGISTSGNSANVIRALRDARQKGAKTVGFTGENGGRMSAECDYIFCAPSSQTPRIQELHILAWHSICEIMEIDLMG